MSSSQCNIRQRAFFQLSQPDNEIFLCRLGYFRHFDDNVQTNFHRKIHYSIQFGPIWMDDILNRLFNDHSCCSLAGCLWVGILNGILSLLINHGFEFSMLSENDFCFFLRFPVPSLDRHYPCAAIFVYFLSKSLFAFLQ